MILRTDMPGTEPFHPSRRQLLRSTTGLAGCGRRGIRQAGAQEAGKDPDQMPVLVEQFVVVGGEDEAQRAAELWRFIPSACKRYYNNSDPAAIQQQAGSDISIDKIVAEWPVGTDPAVHDDAIEKLFASGATIVNIHSGQADQKKVIDFYSASVIPSFRRT